MRYRRGFPNPVELDQLVRELLSSTTAASLRRLGDRELKEFIDTIEHAPLDTFSSREIDRINQLRERAYVLLGW